MEQTLCRCHSPLTNFTLERHEDNHKVLCLSGGYVQCTDEILHTAGNPTLLSDQH